MSSPTLAEQRFLLRFLLPALFAFALSPKALALDSFPAPGMVDTDHRLVFPIEVQSTNAAPASITFKIHKTTYALDVYRKNPDSTLWGAVRTTIPAGSATWTDTTAVEGTAYEYRFHAKGVPPVNQYDETGHELYANTYVLAGINVDKTGSRGRVVLVMPTSIQTPLAAEIARFKQDLIGDGWTVHDVLTPDGLNDWTEADSGSHVQVREDIKTIYNTYSGEVKNVILLGRVPQPRSGLKVYAAPDGHGDLGAVAADCYYADVNNTWTDTGTITAAYANEPGSVKPEWYNNPGDNRYDQTHFRNLTEPFEMGWGRIDFRGAVNGGDEIGALRAYLNKLHDYKHAQNGFKPGRRSIMMDGGSLFKHVQEEFFKNIPQLSGLENIERITYNEMPSVAWQPEAQYTADHGPYLYAFTAGNEPNKDSNMARAVFWTAFKSSVSYWDITSWMRERISEPDSWALSWTTLPPRGRYIYHKMGLGGTIGDMMKATINNSDNETGLHGSAVRNYINGAHVVQNPQGWPEDYSGFTFNGHIGDPTLRDQMIESPLWIRGRLQSGGSQVQVEWLASPDATHGYDIYSSTSVNGSFTKRNGTPLHVNATTGELSWTDTAPPSDPIVYMVRARKLEQTPGGSYINASVGRMAEVDRTPAAFAIATATLPTTYLESEYTTQLATSGGNPPVAWAIVSGSLPSGLSMTSSGIISGTPTNAGSFPLTVRATDIQGSVQQTSLTLVVDMFHAWTLLPNGSFDAAPTTSGSFNQTTTNNWYFAADPNTQWYHDSVNKWSRTDRLGRTGAQPGIGYVVPDLKAKQGAVAFRFDFKNTDGSATPNRLDYRIYGINGSFSWDYWNYGSNPTGTVTLLHLSSVAGNIDWTTFESPALPVGSGYDYYVIRFMPSNVDSDLGDFMAIDNLRWSTAQQPPAFYSVTFSAGVNGSLTGDLNQTVVEGGSASTVTAVAVNGYELANWTWAGGSSTANPLTLTNITANRAVTANFQIFNNPPTSTITSPANGATYPQDSAITFSGTGSDPEDGVIGAATWSSSIDGIFTPVGGIYADLSPGTHTITRAVTDSGGKTTTASRTLIITPLSIFNQKFGSSSVVADYIGAAENLFDYIGTDTIDNNRGTLSIVDGRLRNTVAYTDDGNTAQLSAARYTRLTTLPFESNFAVVSSTLRIAPQTWPAGDTNYFGFSIGQNYKTGIFTPSNTPNGPAFASLTFQARAGTNTFRTTGAGGTSASFTVTPSGGVYQIALVVAANAGAEAQTFPSPTGSHTVQPGRLSVWVNGALHLNNTATGITVTNLEDFSFSSGSGTATDFATGSKWNGYYELDDVVAKTVSNFTNLPNTAPTVAITAPANATTVTQGASVSFTGTATDTEDGNLAASATWTSSINGALGTGASLSTSALSVGTHTITYAATDSGSLASSAQISLTVQLPTYTVNYSAGTGGTLTGTTSQTITSGSNATAVTAVPSSGYTFVNWTWSGGSSTANPLTLSNVTQNLTITAHFSVSGDVAQPENLGGGTGTTFNLDAVNGNDTATGLTTGTAWKTFQKVLNTVQPGDTVLIREGDYYSTGNDQYKNWDIATSGTAGQYITFRAYPGETPRFHVDTWNGIQLWNASYIELDGLEIVGLPDPAWLAAEADNSTARQTLAQDRQYFGNGITVTHNGTEPHHIRIRNCIVQSVGGNGIGFRGGNMILVENNTVFNTTHRSNAGNSAISFVELNSAVHPSSGYGVVVRGNELYNNRNRVAFVSVGYITDGNGVIFDYCPNYTADRALVANNLAYNNGGRAFHVYNSKNVDIVHNTAYQNLASPDLQWAGELSSDAPSGQTNNSINFHNNIAVARTDRRAYNIANTTNWLFAQNLTQSPRAVEGSAVPTATNLLNTDPQFVSAATLDFRLLTGSPALDYGQAFAAVPTDFDGVARSATTPDVGAYEGAFSPPPTTYAVNFSAGTGGTLTGTTSQTIAEGSNATAVTAVPDNGYSFVNWTWTGGNSTSNPLTVSNVTANLTVTANFTANAPAAAIFDQDFNSSSVVADYSGTAANLFDFLGTEGNATNNRATLSITNGRLRNTVAYTDDGNTVQLSASRYTRLTNLPIESNFAVVSATARLAPQAWPAADTNYLSFTIGQNFRTGIYTPSSGTGNGPAFASFTVQARSTANAFRTTGAGGNSANFNVNPSGGVHEITLVIAANAGPTDRTFPSPTGSHTVQPGRLSVWVNGALHLNNTTTGITAANLEDFSFSTGSGTNSTFAAGSVFNGFYEIDDVKVQTVSNFGAANTAPTVAITAPANATTVTQGASVTFTGTATDTEDGNLAASATWTSSLDGSLGTGASLNTSALSVGTHTITYAVTDSGDLSDSEQITLTVVTPLTAWAAAAGLSGADALPDAVLMGDGMPNLLRYALGGTPTTPASELTPVLTPATHLQFTFTRIADPTLTYEVWASNDLVTWGATPVWSSTGGSNVAGSVTVEDTVTLTEQPRRFLRLRIVSP